MNKKGGFISIYHRDRHAECEELLVRRLDYTEFCFCSLNILKNLMPDSSSDVLLKM